MLLLVLFVFQISAYAALSSKEDGTTETNAVLQDSDITGFRNERHIERRWVITAEGMDRGPMGLDQEASLQGVKVFISYAEFSTSDEAHQGLISHIKDVSSLFLKGMWPGAEDKTVGDETWYSLTLNEPAVFFRSGRFLILISCHGGDHEKQKQVAELVATRIASRIKNGARIVLPADTPKN